MPKVSSTYTVLQTMAILPILIAPDPVLRRKAAAVTVFDDDLRTLIDDMQQTMGDAKGIGLAAPQIGRSIRVVVIDCTSPVDSGQASEATSFQTLALINPKVISRHGEPTPYDEGCLSLPGYDIPVQRQEQIDVEFQDVHGETQRRTFEDLTARCVQHEIDHLDGVLIIDYASQIVRQRILRELRQHKKKTPADSKS